MKPIPFSYIARNLWVRRFTTLLTAGGMALVVYVFATVLMMSEGIRATLVATHQTGKRRVIPSLRRQHQFPLLQRLGRHGSVTPHVGGGSWKGESDGRHWSD